MVAYLEQVYRINSSSENENQDYKIPIILFKINYDVCEKSLFSCVGEISQNDVYKIFPRNNPFSVVNPSPNQINQLMKSIKLVLYKNVTYDDIELFQIISPDQPNVNNYIKAIIVNIND